MKKIFSNSIFRGTLATLLVIAMCAIQYESGISDYKFWIASIVIVCVMIYLLILIAGLVKRINFCQKELAECKAKIKEIENQNTNLIEQN